MQKNLRFRQQNLAAVKSDVRPRPEGVANGLSKKFGSRKILADFHGSRSLVVLAVVRVSESRLFDEAVSKFRFFDQRLFLALCLLLLIALVVHKRW